MAGGPKNGPLVVARDGQWAEKPTPFQGSYCEVSAPPVKQGLPTLIQAPEQPLDRVVAKRHSRNVQDPRIHAVAKARVPPVRLLLQVASPFCAGVDDMVRIGGLKALEPTRVTGHVFPNPGVIT